MKKLSENELIDLVALNRVLGYAEELILGLEDGYYYISEGHMAMKVRISDRNLSALSSIIKNRFNGEMPRDGAAIRSRRPGSDPVPFPLDGIKKFLDTDAEILATDTCIMYQMPTGNVVRALYAEDMPRRTYIFLDMVFLECINMDSDILAVKAEYTSPVVFARGDEAAILLPINMHTPAFMASI